jgi:type VII secretion protein EccE
MSITDQTLDAFGSPARTRPRDPDSTVMSLLPGLRSGRLGRVHLVQLLAAETVVAGAIAIGWRSRGLPMAAAVMLAALLLAALLGRRHGYWWAIPVLLLVRYRRRRRTWPAPGDPRLATLHRLAPELRVTEVISGDGTPIGIGQDNGGWFASVRLDPGPSPDPGTGPDLPRLLAALGADRPAGTMLQVVTHLVPAPRTALPAGSPVIESYSELCRTVGIAPAEQITWLTVRTDAWSLARSGVTDLADLDQVPALLATMLCRLVRAAGAGSGCRALDAGALIDALTRSHGSRPDPADPPTERRGGWYHGGLVQVSWWLRGWPAPSEFGALVDGLATIPAALASVAVTVRPGPAGIDVRGLVRVGAEPERLSAACAAVDRAARRTSARLVRLNRQQAPAAYASAPTGGGPR